VTSHLEKIKSPAKLAEYASYGNWLPAKHLVAISNLLVRCSTSKAQDFLSVQVSVRHGKSELVSKWFPVWYLGLFPEKNVCIVTYNEDFAKNWGRQTRDLYAEWAPELFDTNVRDDVSSVTEWKTTRGGGLRAVGMGGSLTGLGFDLIIIDDPIKNVEEAMSPTTNRRMREWYDSTLRTRLMPGGTMILTMARWTDYDLAAYVTGELVEDTNENPFRDEWQVVKFPAVAEAPVGQEDNWTDSLGRTDGEALWPEMWSLETLRPMMGTWGWDALYQQNPIPRSGNMFPDDKWNIRMAPSDFSGWRLTRYWDTAASQAKGDWTVGVLLGLSPQNETWVLDVVRDRKDASGVERMMQETAQRDGRGVSIRYEEDKGDAGKQVTNSYARLLIGYDFRGVPVQGDKQTRASMYAAAQQNGLIVLAQASWNQTFIEEHRRFPRGRHDDQVDAAAGAFNTLTDGGPTRVYKPSDVVSIGQQSLLKRLSPYR
jgi:predicted phage terminase large subunit-like protein